MDHECESGLLWKNQHANVGERKGCLGVKTIYVCLCVYTLDSIMKPIKHCLKMGKRERGKRNYNAGSELVQCTLYTCIEFSQ
jgi:hypothetical protein